MVDYTVEYEGQTANQNSDLVALGSLRFEAILPGENSNLADNTVLVPQGLWKSAGLNGSSRLKAHGPLGEVELKPGEGPQPSRTCRLSALPPPPPSCRTPGTRRGC